MPGESFEVVPGELAAAAGPLRHAASTLAAIADSRRALAGMLSSVPTAELAEAAAACLRAYELAVWELSDEAVWLAQRLTDAAGHYADTERRLAAGTPVRTARVDMPPLRDPVAVATPMPAPAPAPVPPG